MLCKGSSKDGREKFYGGRATAISKESNAEYIYTIVNNHRFK
jgi:hypothetical protein